METGIELFAPKTAVVLRREMMAVPEVLKVLGPVERSVFLASTAKTIAEHTDKELAAELGRALPYIMKDVGYRDNNANERGYLLIRLCEILKRYYAGLTLRDFRMAFEMAITGELDDYLPKGRDGQPDRGHYQNFGVEYICKVLNAYKGRRDAVLVKANDAMPRDMKPKINPAQAVELSNATKRDCVNAFAYYKENGVLPRISPIAEMLYYNILSDAGLAPEIESTEEEKKTILALTIDMYSNKGFYCDVRRVESAGTEAYEVIRGAYELARVRLIKETFAALVADGKELSDYVQFE